MDRSSNNYHQAGSSNEASTYFQRRQESAPLMNFPGGSKNFTSTRSLSLMPVNPRLSMAQNTHNDTIPHNKNPSTLHGNDNPPINKRKKTPEEAVRFLTGNIEKIIKWNKMLQEYCLYEVIAPVVSFQSGAIRLQKVMLLRDKTGPVLKVVYYVNDRIDLPNFYVGQIIRCVGRMIGSNTLQSINIREATPSEINALPRMYYICDQEIKRNVKL